MGHRAFGIHAIQRSGEGGERGLNMNDFKKPHKYRFQSHIPIPGHPTTGSSYVHWKHFLGYPEYFSISRNAF